MKGTIFLIIMVPAMIYAVYSMKFFPVIQFVDEIPADILDNVRNKHLYNNIGGTYNFETKSILIKRNTGQTKRLLIHELGHWLIALSTKSEKVHTFYDSFHLRKQKAKK